MSDPVTPQDLARWRALCDALPADLSDLALSMPILEESVHVSLGFAAEARTALPALIAEVERLRAVAMPFAVHASLRTVCGPIFREMTELVNAWLDGRYPEEPSDGR